MKNKEVNYGVFYYDSGIWRGPAYGDVRKKEGFHEGTVVYYGKILKKKVELRKVKN
ncbi:MAG: hypothetical protein AABY22_28135 [Nanoarchaeota archaeon]